MDGEPSNVPKLFLCPITLEIMKEPTITSCGHMFEKDAIIGWLKGNELFKSANSLCPICNQPVNENQLSPCFPVKTAIEDFLANPQPQPKQKAPATAASATPSQNKLASIGHIKEQFTKKNNLVKVKASVNSKLSKLTKLASSKGDLFKGSQSNQSASMRSTASAPWAVLVPITRNYELQTLIKDEFVIGRSSSCDLSINKGEISSKHCRFYRVVRNNPPLNELPFDPFLEDLSTNGTYLNGKRQSRDDPACLKHGDEISLGNRFTSQEKPEIITFIDWVFLGTLKSSPWISDIEKMKSVRVFDDFIEMGDTDLINLGVENQEVRMKILGAIKAWNDEHHLPVYRFEIIGIENYPKLLEPPSASLNMPVALNNSGTILVDDYVSATRQDSMRHTAPSLPSASYEPLESSASQPDLVFANRNFNLDDTLIVLEHEGGGVEYIEPLYGFSSSTYMADAKLRQVILTIRRNYLYGPSYIFLSTTTEGTALPDRDFQPLVREQINFPDHAESMSYVFHWGLGAEGLDGGWGGGESIQTINFVLKGPDGSIARSMEGCSSTAVLIIEGSGQPEPLPKPKTEEDMQEVLMNKFTNLFADVSRVTISGIISRERNNSKNKDLPALEENIMKKILWYRDLPLEEESLPEEMSYDQASFKYKRSPSKTEGFSTSAETSQPPPAAESENSPFTLERSGTIVLSKAEKPGRSTENIVAEMAKEKSAEPESTPAKSSILPPLPEVKGRPSLSGVFKVPPPPPSIASASTFTSTGFVLQSELKSFVLLASLDYLRSSFKYSDFMSQNYSAFATHRSSLSSSVCKEVCSLVIGHVAEFDKVKNESRFEQKAVMDKVIATTDSVMKTFMSMEAKDSDLNEPKLTTDFEACITSQRSGMETRGVLIEDLNGLFGFDDEEEIRSLYAVMEGFGGPGAAEYAATHLPGNLMSQKTLLSSNPTQAIEKAFLTTGDMLMKKNSQEESKYGVIGTMMLIQGKKIYVTWLGSSQAFLFRSDKTSLKAGNLALRPVALTKRAIGKIESLGIGSDDDMIDDWLCNPDIVGQLDLSENTAKPHVTTISNDGDEQFLVLGSRLFWKTLTPEVVADILTKYSVQQGTASIADYLVSQARKQDKTAKDLTVLVLKFAYNSA